MHSLITPHGAGFSVSATRALPYPRQVLMRLKTSISRWEVLSSCYSCCASAFSGRLLPSRSGKLSCASTSCKLAQDVLRAHKLRLTSLILCLRGNTLIIGASCSIAIALTWGGVQFPWSSTEVLVPLCLGFAAAVVWVVYEYRFCERPAVCFCHVSQEH